MTTLQKIREFIFPELKESEDERIRKELKEAFEAYDIESKWNGIPVRSIFAWLERQKEPENTSASTMAPSCWEVEQKEQKVDIDKLRRDIYQSGYNDGYQHGKEDAQKEQKPADCIEDSVKFEEGFKAGRESGLRDGQKYVLNNLDSYGLCKPAECLKAERDGWYICIKDYYRGGKKQYSVGDLVQAKGGMHIMGEEDISEWFRRAYYEEVRDAFTPNIDTNIPEKPKQEWSKEDEKMLNEVLDSVAYAFYDQGNEGEIEDDPAFLWLHRLRPSWKPSEEQMEALEAATVRYQSTGLESLYEDLKKL